LICNARKVLDWGSGLTNEPKKNCILKREKEFMGEGEQGKDIK
jgi:hypothetical protein